jgi:hypothetical protein
LITFIPLVPSTRPSDPPCADSPGAKRDLDARPTRVSSASLLTLLLSADDCLAEFAAGFAAPHLERQANPQLNHSWEIRLRRDLTESR